MTIITIARGSCSEGREVAEATAEPLGYACVSRDVLIEGIARVLKVRIVAELIDRVARELPGINSAEVHAGAAAPPEAV
jgi:hypothetical protein